jgi:hypothetical protein
MQYGQAPMKCVTRCVVAIMPRWGGRFQMVIGVLRGTAQFQWPRWDCGAAQPNFGGRERSVACHGTFGSRYRSVACHGPILVAETRLRYVTVLLPYTYVI